jgi:preprotein translocase subunit SecE
LPRETRAQRRARRQQRQAAGDGLAERARARQARLRPQDEDAAKAASPRRSRDEPRVFGRFFVESWGELKKVEWPSQNHVVQGTVVVMIACVILGVYIWLADIAFKDLVNDVLLR